MCQLFLATPANSHIKFHIQPSKWSHECIVDRSNLWPSPNLCNILAMPPDVGGSTVSFLLKLRCDLNDSQDISPERALSECPGPQATVRKKSHPKCQPRQGRPENSQGRKPPVGVARMKSPGRGEGILGLSPLPGLLVCQCYPGARAPGYSLDAPPGLGESFPGAWPIVSRARSIVSGGWTLIFGCRQIFMNRR